MNQKQKDTILEEWLKAIILKPNMTPLQASEAMADWWLQKLDQAYQQGAKDKVEEVRKWISDNEYCSMCCSPKKFCTKWGHSASAIDTEDLLKSLKDNT
jgi:hypothetical protein